MGEPLPLIRVMAMHALAYCERLFYLEEIEEIRVADERVYAGRTLHETLAEPDSEYQSVTLESEAWGLKGRVDYLRYRDGGLVVYEHKRGRSKGHAAWESDRLQIIAYCALLSEHLGRPVPEGRIRYHANNKTVRITADNAALNELRVAVARARDLAASIERPPVTENENLCVHCSLAPVCLPEEERLLRLVDEERETPEARRLFPANDQREILHICEAGTRVSKSGEQIVVKAREGEPRAFPGKKVSSIVLHGGVQISTQLIHYAVANDIGIHWMTGGGSYAAGLALPGGVQRRLRQYKGLTDGALCLRLARQLATAKVENQLAFLWRAARNRGCLPQIDESIRTVRGSLRGIADAADAEAVRGYEGVAGRLYLAALPALIDESQEVMAFSGRTRRPPRDPFNAALSFGYSLLYRDVLAAIICVGLEPAIGFFHRPRSATHPLALDMMELFRTTLWDMALVASINRRQWTEEHFVRTPAKVWLSDDGRKQAIKLYETRKQEEWHHPVLKYSLSYARAIELELRLLEKEWSGSPGLFAQMRIR
jgi:CRISPR-associated protein Cas1